MNMYQNRAKKKEDKNETIAGIYDAIWRSQCEFHGALPTSDSC